MLANAIQSASVNTIAACRGNKLFKFSSLIKAFRLASLLRDSSKLLAAMRLSLAYAFPACQPDEDAEVPSKTTLGRARFRIDILHVILRQKVWESSPPTFVYLGADSSPQGRVLRYLEQLGQDCERTNSINDVVARRLMPVVSVGSGRGSVANKAYLLLHQIKLEVGPNSEHLEYYASRAHPASQLFMAGPSSWPLEGGRLCTSSSMRSLVWRVL
mmetsp:Transcript_50705/g.107571  ORF Transcript_50705/g.107571 Transcript_50705/m.107571 type:complete len:215 (-) Transcript_50705:317-961(-)